MMGADPAVKEWCGVSIGLSSHSLTLLQLAAKYSELFSECAFY
jgi:hypothetical protein